jgi:hypothetical protein
MNEKNRIIILHLCKYFLILSVLFFSLTGFLHIYYNITYCEVMTPQQYIMFHSFNDNYTIGVYGNINQLSYFYSTNWYGNIVIPEDYSFKCGLKHKNKIHKLEEKSINYSYGNITLNDMYVTT